MQGLFFQPQGSTIPTANPLECSSEKAPIPSQCNSMEIVFTPRMTYCTIQATGNAKTCFSELYAFCFPIAEWSISHPISSLPACSFLCQVFSSCVFQKDPFKQTGSYYFFCYHQGNSKIYSFPWPLGPLEIHLHGHRHEHGHCLFHRSTSSNFLPRTQRLVPTLKMPPISVWPLVLCSMSSVVEY